MEFTVVPTTFGEVFLPCDLLSPALRLWLACTLGRVGLAVPLFGNELASLPLPNTSHGRAELRDRLRAELPRVVTQCPADRRLSDVVPWVLHLRGDVRCGTRLATLLGPNGGLGWRSVSQTSLGDLDRNRSGKAMAVRLLDIALTAVLDRDIGPTEGSVPSCQRHCRKDTLLEQAELVLEAVGDTRDRALFDHLHLRLGQAATGVSAARSLGLTDDYVRRLRGRCEERARAAFEQGPPALADTVGDFTEKLGTATTGAAIEDILRVAGLPSRQDPRSAVLLWLAGPYFPVPGQANWFAVEPAALVAETRRALSDDGGVRDVTLVLKDLAALGVVEDQVEAWLQTQPVAVVDDVVVSLSGLPAEVAERVLFAAGRALTASEMATWLESSDARLGPHLIEAIGRALSSDRRFVDVSGRYELAEWSAAHVRAAAAEPSSPDQLGNAAGEPKCGAVDCTLRVVVDPTLLTGASGPIDCSLVAALGISAGAARTFATRYGPVAIAYAGGGARHGSLRPVARAAGAVSGDTLVLHFTADNCAAVELEQATTAPI